MQKSYQNQTLNIEFESAGSGPDVSTVLLNCNRVTVVTDPANVPDSPTKAYVAGLAPSFSPTVTEQPVIVSVAHHQDSVVYCGPVTLSHCVGPHPGPVGV